MFTALMIAALPVEYQALRAHLNQVTERLTQRGTSYEVGQFASGEQHCVVNIFQMIEPGNDEAALVASEAIRECDPQVVMFVGIAGGLKDVELGDVVAATKVYGYTSGAAGRKFLPRPDVGESSEILLQQALAVSRTDWLTQISTDAALQPTRVYIGPIAAGPAVLKSTRSPIYRFLKDAYSDALAVEMEGRGFLRAARRYDRVRALVVRGVSDLIRRKSATDRQGWQAIAARNAAAFAYEVLTRELIRPSEMVRTTSGQASYQLDPKNAIQDLVGTDPVRGNQAVATLSVMGEEALPLLKSVLMNCGFNSYLDVQASFRLPKVFGTIGNASIEPLLDVIRNGRWAAKTEASRCFRQLPQQPASSELAALLKSFSDHDVARCAIEALGWIGCWEFSHHVEEITFDRSSYDFEKLRRYAFRAFALMLARKRDSTFVPSLAPRVEAVLKRWREQEQIADSDLLAEWKWISGYFLAPGTEEMRLWAHTDVEMLRTFAVLVFRSRRAPFSLSYLQSLGHDHARSQNLRWLAIDTIGEIGTQEACDLLIAMMDARNGPEPDLEWRACVNALSKVYHHLNDEQYAKYGAQILLPQEARIRAWYTGYRRIARVTGMEKFLDSTDEWVRRPAAICLGMMEGAVARSTLRRYLRHAPTQMDEVFLLAGLLRSGADEYHDQYRTALGHALTFQTIGQLDYIWKRELVSVLYLDASSGAKHGDAWAELFGIDARESADEICKIVPSSRPLHGRTSKSGYILDSHQLSLSEQAPASNLQPVPGVGRLPASPEPAVIADHSRVTYSVTFDNLDEHEVVQMLPRLIELAEDRTITIKKQYVHSLTLYIEGTRSGYNRLRTLYKQGRLAAMLGATISDFRLVTVPPKTGRSSEFRHLDRPLETPHEAAETSGSPSTRAEVGTLVDSTISISRKGYNMQFTGRLSDKDLRRIIERIASAFEKRVTDRSGKKWIAASLKRKATVVDKKRTRAEKVSVPPKSITSLAERDRLALGEQFVGSVLAVAESHKFYDFFLASTIFTDLLDWLLKLRSDAAYNAFRKTIEKYKLEDAQNPLSVLSRQLLDIAATSDRGRKDPLGVVAISAAKAVLAEVATTHLPKRPIESKAQQLAKQFEKLNTRDIVTRYVAVYIKGVVEPVLGKAGREESGAIAQQAISLANHTAERIGRRVLARAETTGVITNPNAIRDIVIQELKQLRDLETATP